MFNDREPIMFRFSFPFIYGFVMCYKKKRLLSLLTLRAAF